MIKLWETELDYVGAYTNPYIRLRCVDKNTTIRDHILLSLN